MRLPSGERAGMLTSGPFGRYTWGAIAVILAALLGGALALASTSYALLAADGRIVHNHPGEYHSTAQLQADISRYLHVHA